MGRAINFSAGPAALPLAVLQRAAEEMTDWRGCGMSVMATSTSRSPSLRSTAMMPLVRGREKFVSGVFLTVPLLVAMNT